MYTNNFFKGMGAGLAVGMAIGIAFAPKKKTRGTSGKFIKAVGDIVDNVSDFMIR
jgi:gas vesicle protein